MKKKPLVSICLITYNHEKYIKQAVDSILNQHFNFDFELLIADDASTDSTQQILLDNYGKRNNVRLILRKKNSEGKNSYLAFQEARGKYIYTCEGDDYWIGQDGLQTLLDWLISHEGYVGVCGRRITLSEKTGFFSLTYDKKTDNTEITLDDFLNNKATFDACAILYKNFYHDERYDYRHYLACRRVGDLTKAIYILLHGKIFQLDKLVGVYRADRVKGAGSYNETTSPKQMLEEHIDLLAYLPKLITEKLDYAPKKRIYINWYIASIPSTYDFIKRIPYMCQKVGITMTMRCLRDWICDIRK